MPERERFKTARPLAQLRQGRNDWFKIQNLAGGSTASIYVYDEIGYWGVTASDFVAELSELTGVTQIDLHINSPGGDVFEGLAIMNCLRAHPANVTTYVDGIAASIASVIAMAGDQIIMGPHSQLMIHEGSALCIGNAADMRKTAELLDFQSDNIAGVYAARAGGTVEDWRALMVAETWYTAEEAVSAGLADEVAQRPSEAAIAARMDNAWDLSVFQYAGRDKAPAPGVPAVVDTAAPVHHTATEDRPWDAGPNEKRLPSPMTVKTAKGMYAWYDDAQVTDGELPKSACKLPHHEVSADGTPGAANLNGVRNALSRLPQSDIPASQHDAVRKHLQAHLDDAKAADNQAATSDVRNVTQQFTVGDRVRVTGTPHEEGHSTGTVDEINGNAYGITFDGMEDMGVHHWYTDDELGLETDGSAPANRAGGVVAGVTPVGEDDPVESFPPSALTTSVAAALGEQLVAAIRASVQPASCAAEVVEPAPEAEPEVEPAGVEPVDELVDPAATTPEATPEPATPDPVATWRDVLAHLTVPAPDPWSAALAHLLTPHTSPSAATTALKEAS